jgi:hypothetical protein
MKRAHWTLLALAAAVCICSLPAAAGTIFDDFGAGNSYNCCTGWTVSGPASPPGQFISANEFTAGGGGGVVTSIDLAIGLVVGDGSGTVGIYNIVGGHPDLANPITTGSFTAHQPFGQCCAIETVSMSPGTLMDGTSYFIVLQADSITWDAFNFNSINVMGDDQFSQDNGNSWVDNGQQLIGAFRITSGGATTPEPGTLVMLGSGALALAGALRRKINL